MVLKRVRENEAAGPSQEGIATRVLVTSVALKSSFIKNSETLAQSRYLSTFPLTSHLSGTG